MAVRLVEAKDGVMQLVVSLRELPLVSMGALNVQPFKRLARLADAHGSMSTARIRSLATRLSAVLPSDNDASETERAKWVWQLAVLERSATIRALGYLKAAQAGGKWDETVAALGGTGRFTVAWMAAVRAAKQAASAAAAAAAAAGAGFENIPTLDVVTHVMSTVPVAESTRSRNSSLTRQRRCMVLRWPARRPTYGRTRRDWRCSGSCGTEIMAWIGCRTCRRRFRARSRRC